MVPKTIMVTANTVGATRDANVLKILPVHVVPTCQEDSYDHGTMSMDFKNPKYFEVAATELNELSFKLVSVNKNRKIIPVDYDYGDGTPDAEICIRLHFLAVVVVGE